MTHIAKNLVFLVGLILVAGFATAAPASGSTIDATCSWNGQFNLEPPTKLGASRGSYQVVDLSWACVGDVDGEPDVFQADLATGGTYAFTNCFTGLFQSTSASGVIVQSVTGNEGKQFNFPYRIDLVDWVGQMIMEPPATGDGAVVFAPSGPVFPDRISSDFGGYDCTSSLYFDGEVSLRTGP
jgi:hypothetical protein